MGRLAGIARREKKRAEMEQLSNADVSVETGIACDSRGKPGIRQVTLLGAKDWQLACDELGVEIPWTARRANLLIEAMDLPKDAGHMIEIGTVRLQTTVEVDPCSRMDEAQQGLRQALVPNQRGGIACRVIEGGRISVGDSVNVVA